jgi:transcriptional regulator with XRE-family HTH domain
MLNKITQITSQGSRVALCRKEKNLSQQEFADILNVSRGYIGDIERNRSEPSSNFLTLLSSNLNVSIDWVLTGEGEMYRIGPKINSVSEERAEKFIELFDALNEAQQKEILAACAEKKRMNELEQKVDQLEKRVG